MLEAGSRGNAELISGMVAVPVTTAVTVADAPIGHTVVAGSTVCSGYWKPTEQVGE